MYNTFHFKSINLSFSSKISIIWAIVSFISLCFPWIIDEEKWFSWNSFHSIWWNIGFWMTPILFLIMLIILSYRIKEKINFIFKVKIKNYSLILFTWVLIILIGFIYTSFINWLSIFFENIHIWNGVILYIVSWIMLFLWWYLEKKQYYKENLESFMNQSEEYQTQINYKKNMKLPF